MSLILNSHLFLYITKKKKKIQRNKFFTLKKMFKMNKKTVIVQINLFNL